MRWKHSTIMSTCEDSEGIVVVGDDGAWEAFPYGVEAGSRGAHPTREEAIETVEWVLAADSCCTGDGGECA